MDGYPCCAAGYEHGDAPRGEFTIVVSGAEAAVEQETDETLERRAIERIRTLLASGLSVREVSVEVARLTGLPRRQVYRLALDVSDEDVFQHVTDSDDDA